MFDRRLLRLASLSGRKSRVDSGVSWKGWDGSSARSLLEALPDTLAVRDMRVLARDLVASRERGAERILMYGGHVIKCGLGPLLSDWLGRGVFTSLATNGAGSIHDLEMACEGVTSEDVEAGIADGSFGMWEETSELYGSAVDLAAESGKGLGEALGMVATRNGGDPATSPLVKSCALGSPLTVHPALGTDIVHPVPRVSWERLAAAAERDFDLFGERVGRLGGGVVLNAGSAVVMPEVFLKALVTARNLGCPVSSLTAASFDMIRHYRPGVNVLARPVSALGGRAVSLTGHHELMLPLLDAFVRIEEEC